MTPRLKTTGRSGYSSIASSISDMPSSMNQLTPSPTFPINISSSVRPALCRASLMPSVLESPTKMMRCRRTFSVSVSSSIKMNGRSGSVWEWICAAVCSVFFSDSAAGEWPVRLSSLSSSFSVEKMNPEKDSVSLGPCMPRCRSPSSIPPSPP